MLVPLLIVIGVVVAVVVAAFHGERRAAREHADTIHVARKALGEE